VGFETLLKQYLSSYTVLIRASKRLNCISVSQCICTTVSTTSVISGVAVWHFWINTFKMEVRNLYAMKWSTLGRFWKGSKHSSKCFIKSKNISRFPSCQRNLSFRPLLANLEIPRFLSARTCLYCLSLKDLLCPGICLDFLIYVCGIMDVKVLKQNLLPLLISLDLYCILNSNRARNNI